MNEELILKSTNLKHWECCDLCTDLGSGTNCWLRWIYPNQFHLINKRIHQEIIKWGDDQVNSGADTHQPPWVWNQIHVWLPCGELVQGDWQNQHTHHHPEKRQVAISDHRQSSFTYIHGCLVSFKETAQSITFIQNNIENISVAIIILFITMHWHKWLSFQAKFTHVYRCVWPVSTQKWYPWWKLNNNRKETIRPYDCFLIIHLFAAGWTYILLAFVEVGFIYCPKGCKNLFLFSLSQFPSFQNHHCVFHIVFETTQSENKSSFSSHILTFASHYSLYSYYIVK